MCMFGHSAHKSLEVRTSADHDDGRAGVARQLEFRGAQEGTHRGADLYGIFLMLLLFSIRISSSSSSSSSSTSSWCSGIGSSLTCSNVRHTGLRPGVEG